MMHFFFSDDVRREPFGWYDQVRSASPVLCDATTGTWMLFDYASVKRAMENHATFSSRVTHRGGRAPEWLVFLDPPRHTRLRASVGARRSEPDRWPASCEPTAQSFSEARMTATHLVEGLWGVRYQVRDVSRAVDFYTKVLGFKLDFQNLPAFGQVSVDNLKLILSGPGASGSRPMPDGRDQEPGGWNRVILRVKDLPKRIAELKESGVRFRNDMEVGPGGKQIQVEDPDGNPVELFEPTDRQ